MYMLTIISFYILRVRLTFQSSNSPHVRLFCACSEVRTFLKLINVMKCEFFSSIYFGPSAAYCRYVGEKWLCVCVWQVLV